MIAKRVRDIDQQVAQWSNLNEFITSEFAGAALAALAKNGSARDLATTREYLRSEHRESQQATLEFISKFGDESDVKSLLTIAETEYGEFAERAAEIALDLSTDRWTRAREYLKRESMPFVQVGIKALREHTDFPSRWRELVPYLSTDNQNVRLDTAKLFCSRLGRTDLVDLMNQCHEDGTYYYDVIAVFDRSLYGPLPWRSI